MDYYKHCCPVCKKQFEKDDDIVVCPECGTPHHRECFEQTGHCFYEDRHKDETFTFGTDDNTQDSGNNDDGVVCIYCKHKNPEGSKFCNNCSMPLSPVSADRNNQSSTASSSGQQGEAPVYKTFTFDPLGGVPADEDIGEGVTAGEAAKFVKTSTPFYTRLFLQIKKFDRSRFSLAGLLFSGCWMLYRKMYKRGAFVLFLMALCIFAQLYITTHYTNLINEYIETATSNSFFMTAETVTKTEQFIRGLDAKELIALGTLFISTMGQYAISIVCGICGNRWYYNHCVKKISEIKKQSDTKEAADTQLQTKGGVNFALAVCVVVTYVIINFFLM